MKRKGLTRILLVGLVAVTIMLIVRVLRDDWNPAVIVSLTRLGPHELNVTAFTVEGEPAELRIVATGSLQSDTLLAAYPWLLRRSDRSIVWKMAPGSITRDRGMLVSVDDRIWLEPDDYDVYFASYGNPGEPSSRPEGTFDKFLAWFDDDYQEWLSESNQWKIVVTAGSDEAQHRVRPAYPAESLPKNPLLIWTSGPVEPHSVSEYMFEVHESVDIIVKCTGSVGAGSTGGAWIENIESGKHVWDMETAETVPAGGSRLNRLCQQNIQLPRGLYRATYQSGVDHGFGNWGANPPFDPLSWGLTVSAATDRDMETVSRFDPFELLPKIVSLTGIGDDALVSYTFRIAESTRVLVHALGEGHPKGSDLFDYAWIVDERRRKEIWKMSIDETSHAGGSYKNRRSEVVLELEPGSYTVYYKSDGSHSFEHWNADQPMRPQHWGVTVFSLDPNFMPTFDLEPPAPVMAPLPSGGYSESGKPLVSLTGLGDYARVSKVFTLDHASRLHIFALGEMTLDGRYDYGWISDRRTGDVVWQMTRENSERAGGTSKNRKVDTVISLPPGEYEVHYKTDDSHSYPRFKYGGAPDNPDAWGIAIWLIFESRSAVPPVPPVPPVAPELPTDSDRSRQQGSEQQGSEQS